MLVSGIFKQLRISVVVPDVLSQFFEDRKSFLLQMKCAMSASVEIIFFWAWLIILVWENEPKLKETTVNYFEFWTSPVDWRVYTWYQWISKSRCQNPMGFSYIFSWSCQVWMLALQFFPNISTSSVLRKNKKVFFNSCSNL